MLKRNLVLLLAICVFFVFPVNRVFSQQYTKSERQDFYLTYLRSEGFQPAVDEDGDITFRYEGGNYYIYVEDNDTGYFQIVYPNFYRLETRAERTAAAAAASVVTRGIRVVKVYLNSSESNVSISAEMFVVNLTDFTQFFYRLLDIMNSARNEFNSQMN